MIFYSDDAEAQEDFMSEDEAKREERENWLAEREAMERDWDEDDVAPDPPPWTDAQVLYEDELEMGGDVPQLGIKYNNGLPVVFEIHPKEPRFTRFLTEKAAQIYIDARLAGLRHWEAVWKAKEG